MPQHFNFSLSVVVADDVTQEQALAIVQQLVAAGCCDAAPADSSETPLQSCAVGTFSGESSIEVGHWERHGSGDARTHRFDLDDRRYSDGQACMTVGAAEGNIDDMLSVTMEVNSSPLGDATDVPCAHVHFDSDALAFSLFKIGNRVLMRPENGVTIEPFQHGGDRMFWID